QNFHAINVEEGQDGNQFFVFGYGFETLGLDDIGDQVEVGEHDALRQARRAAGVGQRDQILTRVDRDFRHLAVALEQRGKRRGPWRFAQHEYFLDTRRLGSLEGFVDELRDRQEIFRVRVFKLAR